jgi:hypothetical protein
VGTEVEGMGDGRTFGQSVRALDKFIAEQSRRDASQVPDPNSPIRRAYERLIVGTGPSGPALQI